MWKKDVQNKTLVRTGLPACTTMAIGKDATVDGSVIVAHSDDDVCDERVIYVPAHDHPKDSKRAVYYDDCSIGHKYEYNATELRRYIGKDRGPGYDTKDYPPSKPLGTIPQVEHTYAYFDSNYGVMNEHQLMIGECTCGAKVHPEPEPNIRIFYAAELSRVALERCKKARGAVELIGQLIRDYGYYGTGETLLIGDPEEAWVIEMCGYDENGADGIWVAQKVPDDEFFVAANQFRIREVDENRMMYSENLFDVCERKGWWKPSDGQLDWLKAVSWGEYSHPYYSLRRVWRALSLAKPSSNLPAWVKGGYTKDYPFSVKPDKKLSVSDVATIYRDHYEGTEFDLTKGRASGPFGDPTRYEKNPDQGDTWNLNKYHPEGAWERPLSIYRCGMMWIGQGRSFLPDPVGGVCWIGLDRPAANCLMPFYVGVSELPKSLETMNLMEFSFESESESAWWAFNFVANYATIKYSYMVQDIKEKQKELEGAAYNSLQIIDQDALDLLDTGKKDDLKEILTRFCKRNTKNVISSWWGLAKALIVKYNDGCITDQSSTMRQVGYPGRWLCDSSYYKGPVSYRKERK